MTCEQMRDLSAELALGVAVGEERADALRHLEGCPGCRRAVEDLSDVADELLTLAPVEEPPGGFESRVLAGLGHPPPRRRRRRGWRIALGVAAPVAAAAAAVAVTLAVVSDDREVASRYRETLDVADGRYFKAERLRAPGGAQAGFVFAYQGRPSWIFVVVDNAHRARGYAAEVVTQKGRRIALPGLDLDPPGGGAGATLPVDLHDVASIRLLGRGRGDMLEAPF